MRAIGVMEDKNIIGKSNALVDAFYSLTVREHQFIAYAVASIGRNDIPLKKLSVTIELDAFSHFFGLDRKRIMPRDLSNSARRLFDREVTLINGSKKTTLRWIYTKIENSQSGAVTLHFSPDVLPHLTGLKGNYTLYTIGIIKNFTCQHTFPIYELLAKDRNKREEVFTITIDYLRKKLGLENKYPKFHELKRKVIIPIFSDLDECTNLSIDWELVKNGRTVTSIQVIFKESVEGIPPKKKTPKISAPKKNTKNDIKKVAKPGDSWEQARARILEPT